MKTGLLARTKPTKTTSTVGLVSALLALIAACIIIVEKLQLAANPDYVTSCSFNPIISCSDVMSSPQASAFWGFPNPLLGVMGFSVVAMLYFISYFVALPRFIWVINLVGTVGALVFCFWLATQGLFVIQALCIYCFIVWMCTSILTWFALRPVLAGTKFEDWLFISTVGLIGTITAFLLMVFFGFPQYWLSLLT